MMNRKLQKAQEEALKKAQEEAEKQVRELGPIQETLQEGGSESVVNSRAKEQPNPQLIV